MLIFYLIFTSFYDKLNVKINIELQTPITVPTPQHFHFCWNCLYHKDLEARCYNHKIGYSIKKDPAIATIIAEDALRAEHLATIRWMFKSTADKKININ